MTETATTAGVFGALHGPFARTALGSDVVRQLRAEAFARFEAAGLPTPHDEQWRHTNIGPIAGGTFRLPDDRAADGGEMAPLRLDSYEAVFVNGRYSPALSNIRGLPTGLQIASLRDHLTSGAAVVRDHLSKVAGLDKPFTALNTAFVDDGAIILVAAGTIVEKPIHLLFFSTSTGTPSMSSPRVLIVAERGSQAKIVETYAGEAGGAAYFTNAVTEIVLEDGAVVDHYKRQIESDRGLHVGRTSARQGRSSTFNSYSLAFGGALSRTDIDVHFTGEGGECGLYGLFLGHGTQVVDHHTLIDHAAPKCSSREVYKGVLDGKSRGVFFGTIVVRPDAQKTDAHQTNKNLLLSREALVNSTPRLQIEADDVKCKHGSTTGQLDPASLFYLRSRGIGEAEARSLLTYAFAADVIERITLPGLRQALAADLDQRMPGAGAIAVAAS